MHVSVTKLGERTTDATGAAKKITNYLLGADRPRTADPSTDPDSANPSGYYADSAIDAGVWFGGGAAELLGERFHRPVGAADLEAVLEGRDPTTGETLVERRYAPPPDSRSSTKSLNRTGAEPTNADQTNAALANAEPTDFVTVADAATELGVSRRYVRRLVAATQRALDTGSEAPANPLPAIRDGDGPRAPWRIARPDLDEFAERRRHSRHAERQRVVAFDLTYSVPKTLSVLWAASDPDRRRQIEQALLGAVSEAVAYVQDHTSVRVSRTTVDPSTGERTSRQVPIPVEGLVGAAFLHDTSRETEPQLHVHAVVANYAQAAPAPTTAATAARTSGTATREKWRALDGRSIFAHATTSGYLAEAEIQHRLNRVGLAFGVTVDGIAQVRGVPDRAAREFSTRRAQILDSLDGELDASAKARQVAAYRTRQSKHPTGTGALDRDTIEADWADRLAVHGIDAARTDELWHQRSPTPWRHDDDRPRLARHLSSDDGVTDQQFIFDRRDVIEAVVDHSGGRLGARDVLTEADNWLHSPAAIRIRPTGPLEAPHAASPTKYTTPEAVDIEQRLFEAHTNGWYDHAAVIDEATIQAAVGEWSTVSGFDLSDEQRHMVDVVCGHGHRLSPVVGLAGAGKTTALAAAARAFEADGYTVIGAAVNGAAAEGLERDTRIASRTVAGLVGAIGHRDSEGRLGQLLNPRTVVVVDEASTIDDRSHLVLVDAVRRQGAKLITVGDPHQHGAVGAGGVWSAIVNNNDDSRAHTNGHDSAATPTLVPSLSTSRRQAAPHMAPVRAAGDAIRAANVADAIEVLDADGRVVDHDAAADTIEAITAEWFEVHLRHRDNPVAVGDPAMMAESHRARRMLNDAAQARLVEAGLLGEVVLRGAESTFHVGDLVVAREQRRDLYPAGAPGRYVRNGTRGTVIARADSADSGGTDSGGEDSDRAGGGGVVVEFEGRGPIVTPSEVFNAEIRPGVFGALTPRYAVTTHGAQGATYDAGFLLVTGRSTREGVYVGLTRGRHDAAIHTVDGDRFAERSPAAEHGLPIVDRGGSDALAAALERTARNHPVTSVDPLIADVAALRDSDIATSALEGGAGSAKRRAATARLIDRAHQLLTDKTPGQLADATDGLDDRVIARRAALAWAVVEARHGDPETFLHGPTPGSDRERADQARLSRALHAAHTSLDRQSEQTRTSIAGRDR